MVFFLTLVRKAIFKSKTTANAGKDVAKQEPLYIIGWEGKLVQLLQKTVWRFPKRLKIEMPYDSVIPLPGIHLKEDELKHKDTCTMMFTEA
jgi:hypothetical protein